jgi:uncharacterized membrane protein YoaK (UPF0700 family)
VAEGRRSPTPESRRRDQEAAAVTEQQRPANPESRIGLGLALGAGVGAALGVAFGQLAMGVAIGVAVGLAIGVALSRSR